jgi:hypothetical protein
VRAMMMMPWNWHHHCTLCTIPSVDHLIVFLVSNVACSLYYIKISLVLHKPSYVGSYSLTSETHISHYNVYTLTSTNKQGS